MTKRQFTRHTPQAPPVPKKPANAVPEHIEAERAALGHLLSAASERDADAMIDALEDRFFSHLGHLELFKAIKTLRMGHRAVDLLTVSATVKDQTWFPTVGGIQGLSDMGKSAEAPLFSAIEILRNEADLRETKASAQAILTMIQERRTPTEIKQNLKDVADKIQQPSRDERKVLTFTNPKEHMKYEPPDGCCLIGNYDIFKGYEGVAIIGGYPGTGKSLLGMTIALSGATGKSWMERTTHRKFKSMFIQAENGAMRLKNEFAMMNSHYPKTKLEDWIRVSIPPEGGIPFHRPEFRRAVTQEVRAFQPDVLFLDPWTSVAADDKSSDVIEKLAEIRACLPGGDDCPALIIIAHMRKPGRGNEGLRSGRALLHELSGSLALGSTARTVFALLPFTNDMQDDRVLFAYAKHNNDPIPPLDTVWHRKMGCHFEKADVDPKEFWERSKDSSSDPRQKITEAIMAEVFDGGPKSKTEAADALMEITGAKRSTAYAALETDGRFAGQLVNKGGLLVWKGVDDED